MSHRSTHVVFCTRYFSQGGGSTGQYVYETVMGLLDTDPELTVSVLTSDAVYRGMNNTTSGGPDPSRLQTHRLRSPRLAGSGLVVRLVNDAMFTVAVLLRLLTTRTPDLVVVYSSPFLLPGGVHVAHLLRRFSYAYVLHDIYPEFLVASGVARDDALLVRLLRLCQRHWLAAAAAVVVLGRCMAQTVMTRYRVDTRRLHVIPHWPNPGHTHRPSARDEVSPEVTVLYGGNLGYAQDLDAVLDAASIAQVEELGVRFSFVVSGSHVTHWQEAATERGLRNIEFQAAVPSDEYSALIEAADACLIVLRRGFAGLAVPSKLYNLLASGKPVLAVMEDVSETALVIEEHRCGFQVDPGDDRSLYTAIKTLVERPDLRQEMGVRARIAAIHTYPLAAAVGHYQKVIQATRRPSA